MHTQVLRPDPGYVAAAWALGFCSALAGRLLALTIVRRLSHPSLLAFTLGGTLFAGVALLLVQVRARACSNTHPVHGHPLTWMANCMGVWHVYVYGMLLVQMAGQPIDWSVGDLCS